MAVSELRPRAALASPPVGLPVELRVLRDCVSASAELERLLGTPVVCEPGISTQVVAGGEVRAPWAELLGVEAGERVLLRAVRLFPLGAARAAGQAVASGRLWLATQRVPDSVGLFLAGTNLTLGQALRLVGLPMRTRRVGWESLPADDGLAASFGCRPRTPLLRRQMLVLVEEVAVAVTEETFRPARRTVRRPAGARDGDANGAPGRGDRGGVG